YFASTNGKNGFENEIPIGETCCQCCRTDLFVDSKNNIHVAYRDIIDDSIRDMVHVISSDQGKTFSIPERISADNWAINGCPHSGPAMAENKNGLQFAWYTLGNGKGVFYCHSTDNGKTFSLPDSVSGKSSAKHPQIATLDNGDVVIVWDESAGGEKYIARIGFEHRTAEGKKISRRYITTNDSTSEFPVIKVVDSKTVFVAYSNGNGKKKTVYYQIINL
ncbi:MAG: glycoside hydrolase, partial [Bacteroidota bacterium]|nr:glycoside hydrolase [Bacteroidota bacterium]